MGKYINSDGLVQLWSRIKHTFADYTTTVALNLLLDKKQNKTDEALTTTSKEIVGAINEVNAKPILPTVITDPYIGQKLVYDGENWVNEDLPGIEAYYSYGFVLPYISDPKADIFYNNYAKVEAINGTSKNIQAYFNGHIRRTIDYDSSSSVVDYKSSQYIEELPIMKLDYSGINIKKVYQGLDNLKKITVYLPNIETIDGIFSGLPKLEEINIYAPKVTIAYYAFSGTAITMLPKINATNLVDIEGIVYGCNKLTEDISNYEFSSCVTATSAFSNTNITKLPKFGIKKLIYANSIASGCKNLTDINNIDLSMCTNAAYAFAYTALTGELNLDLSSATDISSIFYSCLYIESVKFILGENINNINSAFGQTNIKRIDLGHTGKISIFNSAFPTAPYYLKASLDYTSSNNGDNLLYAEEVDLVLHFTNSSSYFCSLFSKTSYLKKIKVKLNLASQINSMPISGPVTDIDISVNKTINIPFNGFSELTNASIITEGVMQNNSSFYACPSLTNIRVNNLNSNINISISPLVTRESILFMAENRYMESGYGNITWTLHPTAKSRLTIEDIAFLSSVKITIA